MGSAISPVIVRKLCVFRKKAGLTLIEIIVVMAIVSILMGTVVFGFRQLEDSIQSRGQARQLASILRRSRAQAVATNRECRVKFLAEGEAPGEAPVFWLQKGNLSRGSTIWKDQLGDRGEFPRNVFMRFTTSCNTDSSPRFISFNPDGSSNSLYVCILQADGNLPPKKKYAVGVSHPSTGRVLIRKWNQAALRFE